MVDDHDLVRQGLTTMLNNESWIDVTGSYGDPEELLKTHFEIEIDVILMDIKMPKMNGFDLHNALKTQNHDYKTILLSMEVNHAYIKRAISEKVNGYVPKNVDINVLLDAIKSVAE